MVVLTWKLTAVQVLALAGFGLVLGIWLKRKFPGLDRLNIPASVIGGLIYALATMALRDRYLNLEMDLVLRDILMVAFFTTVGMSASLRLVKLGGKQVLWFLGVSVAGLLMQNLLGLVAAKAMGLNPLIGLLAGSVSLTGGPATALAFGGTFEKMGVSSATAIGIASAIFGIVSGGLLGGYVGGSLLGANRLAVPPNKPAGSLAKAEQAVLKGFREPVRAYRLHGSSTATLVNDPLESSAQERTSIGAIVFGILGAPCAVVTLIGPLAVAVGAGGVFGLAGVLTFLDQSILRVPVLVLTTLAACANLYTLWHARKLRSEAKVPAQIKIMTTLEKRRTTLVLATSVVTIGIVVFELIAHATMH